VLFLALAVSPTMTANRLQWWREPAMSECAVGPMLAPAAGERHDEDSVRIGSVSGTAARIGALAPQPAPRGPYKKREAVIST
jgi:hypothetical protein